MELSIEMIVSLGAMAASIITSFVVVKSKVQELEENLKEAIAALKSVDSRLDKMTRQLILLGNDLML
jgi:hypothetical protein